MKSLLCRPSVHQAFGQKQLHEKRQLAGWVSGLEGEWWGVNRLRLEGWETILALPTECTEEPLSLHLSLMHWPRWRATQLSLLVRTNHSRALWNIPPHKKTNRKPQPVCHSPPSSPPAPVRLSPTVNKHKSCWWYEPLCTVGTMSNIFKIRVPLHKAQPTTGMCCILFFKKIKKTTAEKKQYWIKTWDVLQQFVLQCSN